MEPKIIIRKSMLSITWTFVWTILLSVLIIPAIYLIYKIILVRKTYTEVYSDRVIDYRGVLNVTKSEHSLTKVLGVNSYKTFFGKIFGYGDLSVNLVGSHGLSFSKIAKVDEVEDYFRKQIIDANTIKQTIME